MRWELLLVSMLTAGCVQEQIRPEPPTTTMVAQPPDFKVFYAVKKIELKSEWLKPCPSVGLHTYTIKDLNRVIKDLQASVAKCNDDKQKIKAKIDASN